MLEQYKADPKGMSERIKLSMQMRGVKSAAELARRIGEPRQNVSRWLKGEVGSIDCIVFIRLFHFLKVSGTWLATGVGIPNRPFDLTEQEIRMLELFRSVTPERQDALIRLAEEMRSRVRVRATP